MERVAGERVEAVTFARTRSAADILALGFGMTTAVWAFGYIGRMPPAPVPATPLLVILLVAIAAGGWIAGRFSDRGWKAGLYAGLLSGVLNLLILGSVIAGRDAERGGPDVWLWVPGSLALTAALAAAGAWIGARRPVTPRADWTSAFAWVAAATTYLLLVAGGLVTSYQAGLAVVDWPRSFGHNMFLYPLERMVGGIFYEHAHRLFGSLVGLTALVLTIHLHRVEPRRWVRTLSLVALAAVVVQGILGGLRVTGRFTLSQSAAELTPNLTLAVVHGVLGQTIFALILSIAVFTSSGWKREAPTVATAGARTDRALAATLVALLLVQLVLGAVQRHLRGGLHIHLTLAAIVFVVALVAGARLARAEAPRPLRRSGLTLVTLVIVQVALGLGSLAILWLAEPTPAPTALSVAVRTAHQSVGAALLGSAVVLAVWTRRLLRPLKAGR